MEIKVLTEEDYTQSMKLSMYAFQYTIPEDKIPTRKEMLKNHKILGIWNQSNLAAKLHIIPFHIYMYGLEWKMGGVAGVATYPEFRRSGYVKSLMIEAIKQMRGMGKLSRCFIPLTLVFTENTVGKFLLKTRKFRLIKLTCNFSSPKKGLLNVTRKTHIIRILRNFILNSARNTRECWYVI